jgi:coproporphyrinogen III oxidase-like Fe-S oxidoreductase
MSEITPVQEPTEVGSYFVANYPPFSVWTREAVTTSAIPALSRAPERGVPLGLYLHIPFCRKRCHFCYFRVYTDKNAEQVNAYLDTLVDELELYSGLRAIAGRPLDFIYFGGGTPSFLSSTQLEGLVERMKSVFDWDSAREIAFECEPGTLTETKLAAIRELGITRLSFGVENFDDRILELNGRAHRSPEIYRAWDYAASLGFPQINLDLIAGMLGETDATWERSVAEALRLAPDSLTIYQMELPFNTTISSDIMKGAGQFDEPVADWATKRRWVREAFEAFEEAGYQVISAYTVVRDPSKQKFVYTERLWEGADMMGLGVASFGHVNGVHMQNFDGWGTYSEAVAGGQIPLNRAYEPTPEERLIREFVLQLKRGWLDPGYFRRRYDVDVLERFREPLNSLLEEGYVSEADPTSITVSRDGLLRVDSLLKRFFLPEHTHIRYT